MASRFVVGIDLGTTNCALAYVDTGVGGSPRVQVLPIPQVVAAGEVAERLLLPSFLYLPAAGEQPAGALQLPWDRQRDYCVGEFARQFGTQVSTRLVASAKSWLCHPQVDRRAAFLPLRAPDNVRKVSPVEASIRYLRHLVEVWNYTIGRDVPDHRLEFQDVILTVPASFDAAARDLTIEAARSAGLEHLTLLEEPQAAFYAWIDHCGDSWRELVQVGDLVLIADVGGGTTDFTLIQVGEENGSLVLTRLAVGEHLLLGGDNMDLTLAYHVAQHLQRERGLRLDAVQLTQLIHACRAAKETLLTSPQSSSAPVTLLGKGRAVVGGTITYELPRSLVEQVILDGFFPLCPSDARTQTGGAVGLEELGLPYAADPAITRHLAEFLHRHGEALAPREHREGQGHKRLGRLLPTALLFNGGVFKAELLRQRLREVLSRWSEQEGIEPPRELPGADFDLAVARGAAYYGLVRRGRGVRIRGGTARAYYIGVAANLPAVPGFSPPIKALCVAPFGMEEGSQADIPGYEVGLRVGTEAQFRFLGSTTRRDDAPGTLVEDWEGQIEELTPIRATLDPQGAAAAGQIVPVHLHSHVTPVGQLELWLYSRDGSHRWKLEYNVREKPRPAAME
jgi:hypothetical protein